ncbi:hypothetical protein LNV09_14440 [Paucibacter sp. B2R-40]|uniref:hypothetical protein n=1 Tax=Paucibacter sp. B2R-40 TaxID=2893554 RepID=UPI0021E43E1D|nr:hypothetical protein [Paucibacter sp. B2R-40]MCV2355349.1 hypothetical protein [Paucibacter sp. B2R-40]
MAFFVKIQLSLATITNDNEALSRANSGCAAAVASADEEAVLSSITSSEEFTLGTVLNMYAGVQRLRDEK